METGMERILTKQSLTEAGKAVLRKLEPFKYPLLILLLGIGLMLLPEKGTQQSQPAAETLSDEDSCDLERQLEEILCQIEGAGDVQVLLSVETGTSVTYQEDRQESGHGENVERKAETVLVSENGNEVPVVVKTTYPVYKGAVVVCQGADSAAVRLNIVRAVSSLTGLGSDKITVVKMKG